MYFVNSHTDKKEGVSNVIVRHKGHLFNGFAYLHPDDEWSELSGCRYAEQRAEIEALRWEYKTKKAACEECRKFVSAVQQYAKFNPDDPSARAMFRQLNRRIKEVNNLAEEISKREFALKVAIRQQDKFNKKIKKD